MKRQIASVVLLAVVFLLSSQAHAIMIDSFAAPQGPVSGDGSSVLLAPGEAIGNRTITTLVTLGDADDIVAKVTTVLGETVFKYSQGAGSQGQATVMWDGFNVDFSQPGLAVVVQLIEVDHGGAYLEFRFQDSHGLTKEQTVELPERPFMPGVAALALRVPLADFTGLGDLADIEEISITVDGTNVHSLDTQIGLVTAQTPEPGTMLLLGTGLAGLFGYGWRRTHVGASARYRETPQ